MKFPPHTSELFKSGRVMTYPHHLLDQDRTAGASYSSVYTGKGFILSVLEPEQIVEIILFIGCPPQHVVL